MSGVRAQHQISTRSTPRVRSASASADAVAPVVRTSSTIATCRRPAGQRRTRNAPATFSWRTAALSAFAWGGVWRRSMRTPRGGGSPSVRRTMAASSSAWLNPRRRSRRREMGIPITAPGAAKSGWDAACRARSRPSAAAAASSRRYFMRWMRPLSGGAKLHGPTTRSNGGGRSRHAGQGAGAGASAGSTGRGAAQRGQTVRSSSASRERSQSGQGSCGGPTSPQRLHVLGKSQSSPSRAGLRTPCNIDASPSPEPKSGTEWTPLPPSPPRRAAF